LRNAEAADLHRRDVWSKGTGAKKIMTTAQSLKFNEKSGVARIVAADDIGMRTRAAAAVAADHADAVDLEGRFPAEAFDALRERSLLSIMVPKEFGGEGASTREVADVCYALGRSCASTGMIYAMHQTKLACIIRHGINTPWQQDLMRRVCDKQLLMASSTTEGQNGGNIRSSAAAIERDGGAVTLDRAATCISYGLEADGVVTTARRAADALNSDQVLAVFLKEDYTLEPIVGWNTLGMRGTRSIGFKLKAKGVAEQILPEPYERIHVQTMMPVAHLFWSSVWAGVAAGAVERARLFLRNAARHSDGVLPPGAAHFTTAAMNLRTLRSLISESIRKFDDASETLKATIPFQTSMNMLKVEASEAAVSIAMSAMRACGLSGYRNDGDFSISRALRDVLSSPIIINNDRILSNLSASSLLDETPASLG
jgi:acyl-CoA dehydrogenase